MNSTISEHVSSVGFSAAWRVVRAVPDRAGARAFDKIADRTARKNGQSVQQLQANLARVRPELGQEELRNLVRLGMRSYLRYWHEAFMLPSRSHDDIRAGFRLANEHLLDAAMNSGTGAIMVPGHMANWDLAGAWSALRYGKLTTVAERLKPHSLYDQFVAYRSQLGMQVIPSDSPDVMRQLVRTIREGGCVALLGDRDISGNGVAVQMFGATARIPGGPAALSLITGVPVHPVALSYSDGMTLGEVLPPVDIVTTGDRRADITTMTQAIADGLCTGIDRAPQDWHMLQRVWVTS